MKSRRPLAAVLLVMALAGCAEPAMPLKNAVHQRPVEPSPSVSPTPAASPSPSPTPPPDKPKPPPNPSQPISCTGSATLGRAQATGTGPFGTTKTTGTAAVALTFDDGPDGGGTTEQILDLLAQCGVKATFCLNGIKITDSTKPLVQRMVHEGHTLCNHTWRHIRQLGSYGPDLIREDLQKTNDAIHWAVPGVKISYFRAPGGVWTQDYVDVARAMGMTPLHWDVDPQDWNYDQFGRGSRMINHIIADVEGNVRPGSVVLSHDYQKPETVAAYRTLLPWLKARLTLEALPPGSS